MAKLPVVSGSEVVNALQKIEFKHIRTSGSHVILVKTGSKKRTIPVQLHNELTKGTLLIIRQSGMARDEFLKLL